jgi:glycosyltransferase involved in cell wall biosynthesis
MRRRRASAQLPLVPDLRHDSALPMPSAPPRAPAFSIVIPVVNEERVIDDLIPAIESGMRPLTDDYEIVFVDDGSSDGTLGKLKEHSRTNCRVRVYSFRRNLGKSQALSCGFQKAAGRCIVTMDADLQDDPHEIPTLYEHLTRHHVSMVNGWRKDRRDSALKVGASKIFNSLVVRVLFGATFKDMNSGLKLYQADVARELRLYGGMHRFIPLIVTELGFTVGEVPVRHHERKYGSSKYPATKVLTEIPDLLTLFFLIKYTKRPLHFFGRVGSAVAGLGFVFLAYLTWLWLQGIPIGTRPLLSFGILLVLAGGQIVFTGLLADLIVNVSHGKQQEFPLKYSSEGVASLSPRQPCQ